MTGMECPGCGRRLGSFRALAAHAARPGKRTCLLVILARLGCDCDRCRTARHFLLRSGGEASAALSEDGR